MVSENEVYNALTYHWQTIVNIKKNIADSKGTKFFNIPSGKIMFCLDKLVADGVAEIQEREPNKEELARAVNNVRKYRKISAGAYKPYEK